MFKITSSLPDRRAEKSYAERPRRCLYRDERGFIPSLPYRERHCLLFFIIHFNNFTQLTLEIKDVIEIVDLMFSFFFIPIES
ncbi:hypothetical protein HMPREF1475_00858 [Hoylesella oralis HGA0225]|nr:hypothetical protein HMPREF1475_00858 [Hoylesella oralis HGA0225]SHF69901.1 hypothetical protein SAMN05444288_1256 [Hoylesella oralis]